MSGVQIRTADAASMEVLRPRLREILIDSVHHGGGVGFLEPLAPADADAYWQKIQRAVAEERCIVLVASTAEGDVVGTVQLDVDTFPNQPHRATVCKLLVHSNARRRGVGEALMAELERVALEAGRWMLTLDSATDAAVRLYERMGWTLAGVMPRYAMNPDGSLTDTALYWKQLTPEP